MPITLLSALTLVIIGVVSAMWWVHELFILTKYFISLVVPIVVIGMLGSKKSLTFEIHEAEITKLQPLSTSYYFAIIILLQMSFYLVTFWMFNFFLYQTSLNAQLLEHNVIDAILVLKQDSILYTGLLLMFIAIIAIGKLYLMINVKLPLSLLSSFYKTPKKMPGLFIYNFLELIEIGASIIGIMIFGVALFLALHSSFCEILLNVSILKSPLFYVCIIAPIMLGFKKYNNAMNGWLVRKKTSFGFAFVIWMMIWVVSFTIVTAFFLPLINAIEVKKQIFNLTREMGFADKFSMLLLGWFLINTPKISGILGRFTYGFKVKKAVIINLLATLYSWVIIHSIDLTVIQKMGVFLCEPYNLFYSSLVMLFLLWLYASDLKSKADLQFGASQSIFLTSLKKRGLKKIFNQNFMLFLFVISGIGCLGWKGAQYLITFAGSFLLPIYAGFILKLMLQLFPRLKCNIHPRYNLSSK